MIRHYFLSKFHLEILSHKLCKVDVQAVEKWPTIQYRRSQNGEIAEADMAEAVTADAPKADDDQTEARGSLTLLYWVDHR